MARSAVRVITALALAATLGVATARAQAPAPGSTQPEAPEAVLVLLREGVALRAAGDDLGALARFAQALPLAPSLGRTHAQIGLVEHALGRWADAETSLAVALASDDPWIGRHREELVASLEIVRAHLPTTTTTTPREPDAGPTALVGVEPTTPRPTEPIAAPPPPLEPPRHHATAGPSSEPHVLTWVGLATTLAGLAALLPTYLLALDAQSTQQAAFDRGCPAPQTSACAGEHARLESLLAPWAIGLDVVWGVVALGGVLAASGIGLTLAGPGETTVALGPGQLAVHW